MENAMRTDQRMDQLWRIILATTRLRMAAVAIAVAIGMLGGGGETPAQSMGRHERLVAVPAPGPVTLDGDLQDWDRSGSIQSLYDPALADRFTATLAAMHDGEALYLAAHVLDDTPLVNAHDPAVEPEIGWDGDAIQVRLTADASLTYPVRASTFAARQNEPLSKDPRIVHLTLWQFSKENQPCVRLERGMDYHGAAMLVGRDAPVVFRKDADGQGYTLEARLPWKLLGATGTPPKAGDTLALTVQWLWGNPGGTKQIMTFNDVVRGPGFHYQSAENWGRLELSPTGRLAPAQQAASPAALATPLTISVPVADAEAQQVSAALFRSAGDLVRTLPVVVDPAKIQNQRFEIPWDGLDDDGRPLTPGDYRVKFLTHRGIGQKYVTSVHNAGTPPWKTDDGRGSWGGDHGAPVGAASNGRQVYLIWDFSEAGHGLIAVDPQLRDPAHAQKLWGQHQVLDIGIVNQAVAANGQYVFTLQDGFKYGDQKKPGNACIAGVVLWSPKDGRPVNFPFGKRVLEIARWTLPEAQNEAWTPQTAFDINAQGLAVSGDTLYVSLFRDGKVVAFDWTTGEKLREVAVPAPRGLAVQRDGGLLVASGPAVLRLDPVDGSLKPLATGLSAATGIAIDGQGCIYVSDRGTAMQVKVFDSAGKFLRKIGRDGGRPAIGRFDPQGMLAPGGLAVDADGKLWVAEHDHAPRRVSVWDTATGTLLGDLLGAGNYAVMGAADLDQPNVVTTHSTLFDVDYATGKVQTLGTPVRIDAAAPQFGVDGGSWAGNLHLRHVRGETYLIAPGRSITGIFRLDRDTFVARPVAVVAAGNLSPQVVGAFGPAVFPEAEREAFQKIWSSTQVVWADRNRDGRVQVEELVGGTPPGGRHGLYWGAHVDDELTIWTAGPYNGKLFRIPVDQWLDGGVPLYPPPEQHQALFAPLYNSAISSVLPARDKQTVYVIEQQGGNGQTGGGSAEAVSRYTLDGRRLWAYRRTWTNFALSSPLYQPGFVIGAMKFIGDARLDSGVELIGVNGYHGQFNLLTSDGLWVAALGTDNRFSPKMSSNTYFCENFSGFFFRNQDNGRCYLIAGETDTRITEVTGLDTIRTGTIPLTITAEDQAKALAAAMRQGRADAAAAPLAVERVADSATWKPAMPARLDAGAGRTAAIAMGFDDRFLHASFDVQDDSPLKNAGGDAALLFKTGDSVNLCLATDPAADPQRTQAAPGDVRLLVTVVEDEPVVVLYEPVARPGAEKQPRTFSSPTGSLTFDRVRVLADAKVRHERREGGYRLVASIPLADLQLSLAAGKTLRGDVGVLFSNPGGTITTLRSFLFNKDTQITQDVPSEARLEPAKWGRLEVK
jgi:outer membrane protein assembly factor BamB